MNLKRLSVLVVACLALSAARVESVEAGEQAGGDAAARELDSLRQAAANRVDVEQVLVRYMAFLDKHPGTPAAAEAQKDVAVWADRMNRGLVKVGDRWTTAEERAAARGEPAGEGAPPERVMAADPRSASLLYQGVRLAEQGQLPAARRVFEAAVAASAQKDGAAFNNLAVVLWRQDLPTEAMAAYDRAMQAAPGNRAVLDNVAEALRALSRQDREAESSQKAAARFRTQEAALQKAMADRGLYRWGATWATAAELAAHEADKKELKPEMDAMQAEYDAAEQRRRQIEFERHGAPIDYSEQESRRIGRRTAALKVEDAGLSSVMSALYRRAQGIEKRLYAGQYTGQRLIDGDGVLVNPPGQPLAPPPAPQRMPATQPAPQPEPVKPGG